MQIYGVFGTQLLGLRRRLGAVSGAAKKGRCLTTLLDIRTPGFDPGTRLPVSCIREWLRIWITEPQVRAGIRRAWPQVGWVPRAPDVWEVPSTGDGTVREWQFSEDKL
eukprot:3029326-Pyramimonas_sp.AAC.1